MRLAIVVMTTWLCGCGGKAAPAEAPAPGEPGGGRPFDRAAGEAALAGGAEAARAECPKAGQPGVQGEVRVTFAPSGAVTSSTTSEPWGQTPIGGCVLDAFKDGRVPPFDGDPVTLTKSVDVP